MPSPMFFISRLLLSQALLASLVDGCSNIIVQRKASADNSNIVSYNAGKCPQHYEHNTF